MYWAQTFATVFKYYFPHLSGMPVKLRSCSSRHFGITTLDFFLQMDAFLIIQPSVPNYWKQSCDTQAQMVAVSNSVSIGPCPGPGPLQFNIASVRFQNIFWTGLGPCVAAALLFLFISYKPHLTSATKKKVFDVTGEYFMVSNSKCVYATFSVSKS